MPVTAVRPDVLARPIPRAREWARHLISPTGWKMIPRGALRRGYEMPMNSRFAVALAAFALLFACSAQAAWVKVEPADAGFSVFFPATPTSPREQKPRVVTGIWNGRAGKPFRLLGVVDSTA